MSLATHSFSWDGISFDVPENWNIAIYKFPKRLTRVEFEDDYTTRIEAEWTRPLRTLDMDRIQERFNASSRKLTRDADRTKRIEDLPSGWAATLYQLPEKHKLVTAMYLGPASELFCFFFIHFEPKDPEDPTEVVSAITNSLKIQTGSLKRWTLYDISLEIPSDFQLLSTRFETGLKLFVFRWKRRKCCIWFINLADLVLKKQSLGEWMARLFNSSRLFRSLVFRIDGDNRIFSTRRKRHRLGHIDEIVRWCFKYQFDCIQDKENNQLIPWIFSYRNESDLEQLKNITANGIGLTDNG